MFFLLAFLIAPGVPNLPQNVGLRIAEEMDAAQSGFVSEYSEIDMILTNAHVDLVFRRLTSLVREVQGDGDQSLVTFKYPVDVDGTKLLTWSHKNGEDDQWLFLPALNRVKRISSSNKTGSFMGSEFAYEDIGSHEVEEYTYRYLGADTFGERKCEVVERFPVNSRSGYSKEVVWYDVTYKSPLKIEYYDRKNKLLKEAIYSRYKIYGTFWRPTKIEMRNLQTHKMSILTWTKRELNVPLSGFQFHPDQMDDF